MITFAAAIGQWLAWVVNHWEAILGGLVIAFCAYFFFRRDKNGNLNQIIAPLSVALLSIPLLLFGHEDIYNAIAMSQLAATSQLEYAHRIAFKYAMLWGILVPAIALIIFAGVGWRIRTNKKFYLLFPVVALLFSIYFTLAGRFTLSHSQKASSDIEVGMENGWTRNEVSEFVSSCKNSVPEDHQPDEAHQYCECMMEGVLLRWSYTELKKREDEAINDLIRIGTAAKCLRILGVESELFERDSP